MKIIHTADLHFDSKMETNLTKEMARERKMEIRYSFQRLIEYANENDIKVILICGDMFDTANVSNSTRTFLVDLIKGNPQIDFLILKGNHDEYNLLLDEELANVMRANIDNFDKKIEQITYTGGETRNDTN